MAELYDPIELPSFSDRIPELIEKLHLAAVELKTLSKQNSYLPIWEDLYFYVHGLKGVSKILNTPKELEQFFFDLNDALVMGIKEKYILRDTKKASLKLADMANYLQTNDFEKLPATITALKKTYQADIEHGERIKYIPKNLAYINEQVSKNAREAVLFKMTEYFIESTIRLEEIPSWRSKLTHALKSKKNGKGLFISFLPYLLEEGGSSLNAWAWVAVSSQDIDFSTRFSTEWPKAKCSLRQNAQ